MFYAWIRLMRIVIFVCLFVQDDGRSLKSKQREKVRPKLGKMTIEYQKLHDAFFK